MSNNFDSSRFELLSAYLDGEVTPAERHQVQQWLDSDPQTQQLYTQLLRLRREILQIPIPSVQSSSQQLAQTVFQSLDRQQRSRRLVILIGVALAAVFVGGLSSLFFRGESPSLQVATSYPNQTEAEAEPLIIALNRPIIEIPTEAR